MAEDQKADYLFQIEAELASLNATMLPHGLPSDATPFSAVNATKIETTTLQVIKAGVAAVRMFITGLSAVNFTTTEDQAIMVTDEDDVGIACLVAQDVDALTSNPFQLRLSPPSPVAANKDLEGIGLLAGVGDCHVTATGYTGT